MSTTLGKRKRARKACIPCHERKRKCDTVYPCTMCTTYGYTCQYAGEAVGYIKPANNDALRRPDPQHINVNGDNASRPTNRASTAHSLGLSSQTHRERALDSHPARVSSTQSPATLAGASPGIFDEQKFRHSGASSAMAFPHILGAAFGSDNPPQMRSFAYNFGIRPEEASSAHEFLGDLISEDDLIFFSNIYFSILGPIFDLIDIQIYTKRCQDYYHTSSSGRSAVAFAAVAAGVAALGSFLFPNRHPRESELVQYTKAILDDPSSMRLHGIDHIIAWGLRVVYLRATTRPSNAWIASCTQMHLCEAIGLHEEENIQKMASIPGSAALGHNAHTLRRIFWISWAGHVMLSYEYDRSPVQFRAVTCQSISPRAGTVSDQFVKLIQIIPSPNSPFQLELHASSPSEEILQQFKALRQLKTNHPFLLVTQAEIAFCFYRRLYNLKTPIPDDAVSIIIESGNAAVEAAEKQATQGRLFWNVIGSVFQYVTVLLALDSSIAAPHIGPAFRGLENLVKTADTVMTREALSIARHLLSLKTAKKRREFELLEAVEASHQFLPEQQASENIVSTANGVSDIDWEVDWDQFFIEPYLSMLGPDVRL
ncbi:C6 zinc finger domain protein [Aspergillus filifer]